MNQETDLNGPLANGFASLVESAESKLRRRQQHQQRPSNALQMTADANQADPLISDAAALHSQDCRNTNTELQQISQTPRRKLPKVAGWKLKCPAFSTVQLDDDDDDNDDNKEADNQADRPLVVVPNEPCGSELELTRDQVGRVLERRRATQPAVCGSDNSSRWSSTTSDHNKQQWSSLSSAAAAAAASTTQSTPLDVDENGFTLGEPVGSRRVSDCGRFLGRPNEMTNRVFGATTQGGPVVAACEQMNTTNSGSLLDKTLGDIRERQQRRQQQRQSRDKDKNDGRPQLSSSSSSSSPSASFSASAQSARSSSGAGDPAERAVAPHSKLMLADNSSSSSSSNSRRKSAVANEQRECQLIESDDGTRPARSIVSCLQAASRNFAYRPAPQSDRLEPELGDESERDDGPTPTNDPIREPTVSHNNCNKSGDTFARGSRRASVAATAKCEHQRNQEGANANARCQRQQQQSDSSSRFGNSFKVSSPNGANNADKWTNGMQLEQRKRHSEDVDAQVRRQSEIGAGERRHSANVFDLSLAKRLMNKCHISQPSGAFGSPPSVTDNRRASLRVPGAGSGPREAEAGGESASNMNGGASASSLAPYRLAARAIETMQAAAERVAAASQQQQQQQRQTNGAPPEWQMPPAGQRRHSTYMLPLLLLTKRQDTSESDDDDDDDDDDEHDHDNPVEAEGQPRIRVRRQTAHEQSLSAKANLICNLPNSASSPSALSTPTNADSAGGCGGPCCSQEAQLERLSRENRQLAAINNQADYKRIEANDRSDPSWIQQQQLQKSNIEHQQQQQQVILRHRIGSNPLERLNVARTNNGQANSQQQQLIGQRPQQNGRSTGGAGLKAADEKRSGSFSKPRRSLTNQTGKNISSNIKQQQQQVNSIARRRMSMGVTGSLPLRPPRDHPQLIETQQSGHEPVYEPLIPESGFKIVVMGTSGSGKTAIIQRFLYGTFSARHLPTVEDTYFIEFPYRKQLINIAVSDTSGTYQFPAMKKLAINSGDAFILVYSVDDPQSFDDLEQLRQTILDEREQAYLDSISASAGGHNNNDHNHNNNQPQQQQSHHHNNHHHHHHHHHPQASSSTSSSTSSAASSSWALSGSSGVGGVGTTAPSSLTSTDGAHLQHNQLYPLSSSTGTTNQSSQQQQQQQLHLCAASELAAHQAADLSPSRHWSLAALFSNHHHHQQNHNQSSNANNSANAAMHTANQILHQQLFSTAANTTNAHNSATTRTASSLNSSLCSSTASGSTSCSSSADNSRRSSISAAEAALRTRRTRRPPMVIVANKHDLPRDRHQVNSDEIEALVVIDWNNGFVRASAALNWNIDEIFQQVLKQARQPPTLTEAIVSKRRKSLPPKLPHP